MPCGFWHSRRLVCPRAPPVLLCAWAPPWHLRGYTGSGLPNRRVGRDALARLGRPRPPVAPRAESGARTRQCRRFQPGAVALSHSPFHRPPPDTTTAPKPACRPLPNPARVGLADVAVADGDLGVLGAEPPGQLLGHDHRAMPATGAADGDGAATAALGRVVGRRPGEQLAQAVAELVGVRIGEEIGRASYRERA